MCVVYPEIRVKYPLISQFQCHFFLKYQDKLGGQVYPKAFQHPIRCPNQHSPLLAISYHLLLLLPGFQQEDRSSAEQEKWRKEKVG